MKTSTRWLLALALGAALMITAPLALAGNGDHRADADRTANNPRDRGCENGSADRDRKRGGHGDLDVVGLTSNQRLICFEDDDPGDAEKIGKVRGLVGDDRLVGIDYRPATGDLYGLGNNGGVYVVDDETAQFDAPVAAQRRPRRNGIRGGLQPHGRPAADRE